MENDGMGEDRCKVSTGAPVAYIQIPILNIRYFEYASPVRAFVAQHARHPACTQR